MFHTAANAGRQFFFTSVRHRGAGVRGLGALQSAVLHAHNMSHTAANAGRQFSLRSHLRTIEVKGLASIRLKGFSDEFKPVTPLKNCE
jgi:hypothetical protein